MKHRQLLSRSGIGILIGTVLVALVIAPSIAFGYVDNGQSGTQPGGNVPVASPAITAAAAAAVNAYWTPSRMQAAIPLDVTVNKSTFKAGPESVAAPDGPATTIDGNVPGAAVDRNAEKVGPIAPASPQAVTGYTYPFPYGQSGLDPSLLAYYYPWRTNGKLFFSQDDASGVRHDYVCSGTSTTSGAGGNRRLVWTAGHCVNSGDGSRWSYNVSFCPAWYYNLAPYGCWSSLQLWSLAGWVGSGNLRYDQGVIITSDTSSSGNGRLGDTVGTQGLAWNQPRTAQSPYDSWYAFGYPAAAPFDGQAMRFCSSSIAVWDAPNALAGPLTNGIGCNMTGGSSGGGWIWKWRMGIAGYVNSVNSYKYVSPAQPEAMYGPYFDTGTQNLYNTVRVLFP